ncbi:hypothetical protein SAMN05421771_0590 [Granulicella pectinivorans]|uniref:Uncharacterized protein n=1 Tax=Granulicella pectinivorans TaxID=474950 RepID=A0A1I6LE50_9BACT|nr:hypothetical protein [Granulicella pectinivorans]SFS01558.1 hypothetical protein SAMN05421771_0590 [Granulicella pectinivorans]
MIVTRKPNSLATRTLVAASFALVLLAGCKSKQDIAIDQAKQQAASSGQPQQVVWTDKDGNTTTTIVQPPAPGQTTQAITTTTSKTTNGTVAAATPATTPAAAPNGDPVVGPVGAPASQPLAAQPAPSAPQPNTATISPVNVRVPAGTSLAIRINQHINVKTSHAGERFTGEVAEDVAGPDGGIVIPRGTHVDGVLDASHRRGHFKGASILELRLTTMTLNGQQYALDTHDIVRTKKGKGKRSAAFIGGGAGLGMLVGGIATGGVGLVVGGLAGGGAGTAIAGMTGNRDIDIPAESLMRFRLADDLVVQPNN